MKYLFLLTNIIFSVNLVQSQEIDTMKVYEIVDIRPEFPGGKEKMLEFINQNLKFPDCDFCCSIEGTSVIHCIVERDGTLSNITLLRSPSKEYGEQAIKVIEAMPNWTPGSIQGVIVRTKVIMPPIKFKLER